MDATQGGTPAWVRAVITGGILWVAVLQGAFGGLEKRPGTFFAGLGLSMFGFAYLCFAVLRPLCSGRIFWEAVNKGQAGDWLGGSVRIGEHHECPSLGVAWRSS